MPIHTESADVVIIGSGMGGSTTAFALSKRGLDVLVLERGSRLPREPENWSPSKVFIRRRYKPSDTWFDSHGKPFQPGVHYVVGGNTKVYGASLPRLREQDLEATFHAEGTSPAWPFRYPDIERYYCEAERLYRVHGSTGEDPTEPPRSEPYPFAAIPHERYVEALADRLRAAGVHPSSNSMGIDLRTDGSCVRCATCDGFPCQLGAKSDAETCALDPALATGNVRLLTEARVTRVVEINGRVDHLVVSLKQDGQEQQITVGGSRFVLSAGSANSAALLLGSDVSNSSGLVGRNFMMHNNAHIAAVDLNQRNDVTFQKTLSVHDWYHDNGTGEPYGILQLIGKVQATMMKSWATKVPLPLLELIAHRSVEWLVMAEDFPHPDNRVVVDAAGRITTIRQPLGTKNLRRLLTKAKSLLHSAGYDRVFTQNFDISMNSHMCGTTVIGKHKTASVLDPWCRSHNVRNLWVIDAGFFPSSGAVNPALTIAAQALRCVNESDLGQPT